MLITTTSTRAFTFKSSLAFLTKTHMDFKPKPLLLHSSASRSPPRDLNMTDPGNDSITLQEWQAWGTTSPLPAMVTEIVDDLKALEKDIDAPMSFGGSGGKLQVPL
jgi:hypothetical protein